MNLKMSKNNRKIPLTLDIFTEKVGLTPEQKATHYMVACNFRKMYGTDGEVSLNIPAKLTLPDGTTVDVWAYKLEDSQADPFFVAVEKLKEQ